MTEIDRSLGASVSIVIEWDNARVSELGRARAMYRALVDQIHRLHQRPRDESAARVIELVFLYDALEIDPSVIHAVTSAGDGVLPPDVALHVEGTSGLGYYELKNAGAKRAAGDIVVFLDSDVIPEPDWLEEIIRPFRDPAIQLVGGNSYIEPVSLYSRAFALTWFFPLRAAAGPLATTSHFFANNLAGRRDFLGRYPFPDQPRFRGQCTTLAETLAHEGIAIYSNPNAHVAHPPPNGLSHFFRRALCEGHDLVVGQELRGRPGPAGTMASLRLSYWRLRAKAAQLWRVIRTERRRVGLSAAAAPFAFAIAFVYHATLAVGEVLTRRDSRIVRRHFPI